MKFSYTLLKKLVPQVRSKSELMEKLTMFAFEAEEAGGNTIEIKLPPNRYDASSHLGIANELSAIYGKKLSDYNLKYATNKETSGKANFSVKIEDKNLCSRYIGQYFENLKTGPSPKWMQEILIECGQRPINNIVDIMNYVMLETGQPLHAFDFDKLNQGIKNIIVRRAKKGEKFTTLDNQKFDLTEDTLLIADNKIALAIAGIKGGKIAEVDNKTKRIIVEAANFDSTNIYSTSRKLNLVTDASARFSRRLSPELAQLGINRAGELLKEIVKAKPGAVMDIYPKKQPKKILKFELGKFNSFIGVDFDIKTAKKYLDLLGFAVKNATASDFIVEVPPQRMDIENSADLFEEVVRLYGHDNLKSKAPHIRITPSGFEDTIVLKDKIRKILTGLGVNEVYNYSFIGKDASKIGEGYELVELENPISNDFKFLRPNLSLNLLRSVQSNGRFFDEIKLFEAGSIFFKIKPNKELNQINSLGIVLASKNKETFFELKGLVAGMFDGIGISDYLFAEISKEDWAFDFTRKFLNTDETLKIKVEGEKIGFLGKAKAIEDLNKWHVSVMELDLEELLKLVVEAREYKPLPKYPSVVRDISILAEPDEKIGEIMQAIQEADIKNIEDVDLIDEYYNEKLLGGKRSLTFRIVFQAQDKTLTDNEVNKEMEKIISTLKKQFKVEIR